MALPEMNEPLHPVSNGAAPVEDLEGDGEIIALVRQVDAHFFAPPQAEKIMADFDPATLSLRTEFQKIANAFRHNLISTISTVAMPFALADASAHQRIFQSLHACERIRATLIEEYPNQCEDLEEYRERIAYEKASCRMRTEFCESPVGARVIIRHQSQFLLEGLNHGLESAAQELLQQGLVLLWSAFEVLCRDMFEALLNADPAKVRELINHPATRKRFEVERLPLDALVQHGFDLSGRLGSVLVGQQDFSDLPTVKAVYAVLFPNGSDLNQALAHRGLWTLYQRRHLVVHRRGVIDQAYLDATGDASCLGTRLAVSPSDFSGALGVIVAAGTAMSRSLPIENATASEPGDPR
jgi:hypothetical protein